MDILLLQPEKFRRFYKNPIRLQAIYWTLAQQGFIPYLSLCDADASDPLPDQCDYLIIDMTESSYESMMHTINKVKTDTVILINADCCMIETVQNHFSQKHILNYDFTCFMKNITNIFKEEILALNKPQTLHNQLMLTDNIIDNINQRGIQYFSEGVARGCEGSCSFCRLSCTQNSDLSFLDYSSVDFINCSSAALSRNLFIQLTDENFFGLSEPRLHRVCAFAQNLFESGFHGIIGIDTRIDTIPLASFDKLSNTDELLPLLSKSWKHMIHAGLKYCFIGVESFDYNQLKRYHKNINVSGIKDVILFLESNKLVYTFGLILWDPFLTATELQVSIETIENMNLLGKTASLIKPLRVIPGSSYEKQYITAAVKYPVPLGGLPKWDHVAAYYKDNQIRFIARLLFPIYGAFDQAGYRHSDASLFEALYDDSTPDIFYQIPQQVAKLELEFIKMLLSYSENELLQTDAGVLAKKMIPHIESILSRLAATNCSAQLKIIYNYYTTVLSDTLINLKMIISELEH